ncbi:MAG: hypothetical protein ACKN82_13355, partial [Pirellula sp.]
LGGPPGPPPLPNDAALGGPPGPPPLPTFAGSLLGAGVLAGAADPLAVVPFASVDATSVFFDPHPTNVELNITPTRQARRNFMGKPHRRKEWKKQPDKKCHYL